MGTNKAKNLKVTGTRHSQLVLDEASPIAAKVHTYDNAVRQKSVL